MITTYALPIAAPLDGRLVAAVGLGTIGWAALAAVAIGVVAVAALALRERLQRTQTDVPDDAALEDPRAAA